MEKLDTASRALETLENILDEPFSEIVRDATSLRAALRTGLLGGEEVETALEMTDERNVVSLGCIGAVARRVYGQAPKFAGFMRSMVEAMRIRLEGSAR